MEIDFATGLGLLRPVVVSHQRCGAEDQEGEDPVDSADHGGGNGPCCKRCHTETSDHGGVCQVQNGFAGNGQHGGNCQLQYLA